MKLTKNFYLHEFSCNDGTSVPDKFMDNVQELANNLQLVKKNYTPLRAIWQYKDRPVSGPRLKPQFVYTFGG